jgi:hypothetical protein
MWTIEVKMSAQYLFKFYFEYLYSALSSCEL